MKNLKVFEEYTTKNEEHSKHSKHQNYMFFQNIHTIKNAIEDIMNMDTDMVDVILSAGHGWALDHISTSTDDVLEVYHFLKNKVSKEEMEEPASMSGIEIMEEPGSDEIEFETEETEED
jgi:hypothetical protein